MPGNTKVTLILDGEKNDFIMKNDDNILDEALSRGIDVPYSCQGGVCLTCIGKVKSGEAEMDENGMLSDVNELVAVEHLQYAFGVCCFVFLYG